MDLYEMVLKFHQKFHLVVGERPNLSSPDIRGLRLLLIEEEIEELTTALEKEDIVATADALADLLYVTLGAAVTFGIDIRPVMAEVHRANITKLGGPIREDGKILKPEGWTPPDVAGIIQAQLREEN